MPRTPQRATRFEIVAVVLVLLLAAYLRLNHLEWTEFKTDEAHLSQLAYDMARHGQIPLTSIGSSVGAANLPLAAWLLAIPYAVSSDPIVATGFIALTNVAAVVLCCLMFQQWLRTILPPSAVMRGALMATLLFAAAPWSVIYSRKIWANDFLPLFVVGWAWTGWLAFARRRSYALIGHAVLLAACIHLHY
ncbi:MAG TPA: hypothetical protein VII92_05640, partial [Anaerolineae bacterium]